MFTFDFVMNYNKESDIGYTLMVVVDIYRFYLKRVINGVSKLVCTFYDKENYICRIGYFSFKTWLNSKRSRCSCKM